MEMVEETENKGDRARRRGYWKIREDQMRVDWKKNLELR